MYDSTSAIDLRLIDHWVVLTQVPLTARDLLPAGGPVLAYLYVERESQQVAAWVETAVVVTRGRITPIGLPLGRPGDVALILRGPNIESPKIVSDSECERLELLPPLWMPPAQPSEARPSSDPETTALTLALERAPQDPEAHCNLGLQLAEAGDARNAERHLRAAATLSGDEPFFLSSLAAYFANTQRDEEALATYSLALSTHLASFAELCADDPEYWLRGAIEVGLAKSLVALGRAAEARKLASHWLDHPDHGAEIIEWHEQGDDIG